MHLLVSDHNIIYINWEKCQALFSFLIIIFSVVGEYLSYHFWLTVVRWNAIGSCFYADKFCLGRIGNIPLISLKNRLSQEEGLLVGTSSGANVFAALHIDNGKNRVANGTA